MSLVGDDLTRLVRFRQLYSPNFSVRTTSPFRAHFFCKSRLLFSHVQTRSKQRADPAVIRNIATRPEMKVQEAGGIDRRFALLGLAKSKTSTVEDSIRQQFSLFFGGIRFFIYTSMND